MSLCFSGVRGHVERATKSTLLYGPSGSWYHLAGTLERSDPGSISIRHRWTTITRRGLPRDWSISGHIDVESGKYTRMGP